MSGIELTFPNMGEFTAALKDLGDGASEVLDDAVMAAARLGERFIKDNIRDQKLIDTSNLVNSVSAQLDTISNTVATASVGPRGVVYARIHEYGGVIKAKNAPYMVFQTSDGAWHSVKSVKIPARPYLRPAFDEHGDDMLEAGMIIFRNRMAKF